MAFEVSHPFVDITCSHLGVCMFSSGCPAYMLRNEVIKMFFIICHYYHRRDPQATIQGLRIDTGKVLVQDVFLLYACCAL